MKNHLQRPSIILRSFTMIAALLFSSHPARASEESALGWSAFSVESPGSGSSGPVRLSGREDAGGITTLAVEAFGVGMKL